jgi:hypothetical protein
LVADGRAFRFLRLDVDGEQHARVTVTERARRLDLEGATLFGEATSFIDDGGTITCLSHDSRQLVRVPREHVPRIGFTTQVAVIREPCVEGSSVVLDLEESRTGGRFRQRLELDRGGKTNPLIRKVA